MKTAERVRAALAPPQSQRRTILVAGLAIAAFLVFFPAKQLVAEKMRIHGLQSRVTALQAENERLESETKRLSDPRELELLARDRLGLVRPGEKAYLLVPQPTPSPAPRAADAGGSLPSRWWAKLLGLVRGRQP